MKKNFLIKPNGIRRWRNGRKMLKLELADMPKETFERAIEEIKNCNGLLSCYTKAWYVPLGRWGDLKGRLKKKNLVRSKLRSWAEASQASLN